MALPSTASHFVSVTTLDELKQAIVIAQEQSLPIIVLGEGSNSLFTCDVSALVLHMNISGFEVDASASSDDDIVLVAGAGAHWDDFVQFAIVHNAYGIENLSWIPGAVGAAPIQNIGAYGVELSHVLEWVEVIDLNTAPDFSVRRIYAIECELSYRESIFKQRLKNQVIIIRVAIRLSLSKQFNLNYAALSSYLDDLPTPKDELTLTDIRQAVISIRDSKLPNPEKCPNAGSFFKNPIIPKSQFEKLKQAHANIPNYPVDGDHCKLAAAWLIDQAGWKGKRFGNVGVHEKQALVLVNYNQAQGHELMALAREIQASVHERFGVALEIEPRVYE